MELKNGIYQMPTEIIVPTGKILIILKNVITGKEDRQLVKNMFVTAGKNALADSLRGTTANNQGIITYCAMGTGLTAPALSDTQLQTEIGRKLVSLREVNNNTAVFTTFFTTSEVVGSLKEAGLFGASATDTANSGTLFARAAINRTKSANDTLTIAWAVTIG